LRREARWVVYGFIIRRIAALHELRVHCLQATSILAIIVFGWLWNAREKVPQSLASTKAALRLKFVKRLQGQKLFVLWGFRSQHRWEKL
jgi:hypothetical protein